MGIRINVVMGYGLDDIAVAEDNRIIDERINREGYFFNPEKFTRGGFFRHMNKKIKSMSENHSFSDPLFLRISMFSLKRNKDFDPYQCFYYDDEGGFSNVMCFVPPSEVKYWARRDDPIDYELSRTGMFKMDKGGGLPSWYHIFNHPLYPFDGWMDRNDGKRCTNSMIYDVKLLVNEMEEMRSQQIGERLKENFPFAETYGDIYDRYVPIIPDELTELLKYCKVFTNDEVIHQLRPMIYSYWS